MGCKTISKQVDEATAVTTLQGSDEFSIVRNSTLNKITFTNLTSQLGVTGTLTDGSAGTASPVLRSDTANDYVLRGIAPGDGVTVQLDGSDDIEISLNIAAAGDSTDGLSIIADTTASPVTFKRLQAGSGITITGSTDSLEITASSEATTTKTVLVNSMDDFPAPVSGVITLEDDTDYLITNDLVTANRFVLPNASPCVIRAADRRVITLEYTGSGNMFTYTDPQTTFKEIDLVCDSGTFLAPDTNTTGAIEMFKVSISADTVGTIDKLSVFAAQSVTYNAITTDGWSFVGACGATQFVSNFVVNIASGTVIDLGTATFNRFGMSEFVILASGAGTTFLSGAAASANINAGSVAIVDQAIILGSATALNGITVNDAQWQFSNSNAIPDTRTDALGSLSSSQTTAIASAGVPVVLNGNGAVVEQDASQMSVDTNGRITYNGVQGADLPIIATLSLAPSSGGSQKLGIYIAKNGVVITASESYVTTSAGSPALGVVIWQDTPANGDYYEVFLENNAATNDIVVDKFVFRVN